ncbi:MAG: iron ABC transporter permease [Burkholderiales bacterium]|nr:iron ABC transporter permease [Burkholderiales bacterium]
MPNLRERTDAGLEYRSFGSSTFQVGVLVVLALLTVLPLLSLLVEAFTDADRRVTFGNFVHAVSDGYNVDVILNTVWLSFLVAAFSLLFGVVFSFGLARTSMPFKKTLRAIVLVSIISPGFLTAFAYIVLMGPNSGAFNEILRAAFGLTQTSGPLNIYTSAGFVLLSVPMGIGICVLQLVPTLTNMDSSLEEASRIAGVSMASTLFRVTLRLLTPALLSGFILTFTISLSLYGIPQILGIDVVSVAIRQSILVVNDMKTASVLSIAVTLIALAAVALYRRSIAMQKRYITVGARGARSDMFPVGRWKYLIVFLVFAYGLIAFILPYATLLYVSVLRNITHGLTSENLTASHYVDLFRDDFTRASLINSVILSAVSAGGVVALGLASSYLLVRMKSRFQASVDYLSILPLGLAGTAFGIAVLLTYINPPLRVLGFVGTLTILALAYVGHFLAFGVRGIQTGLLQISPELSEAARMCGSGPIRTMKDVDLPLIKGSLVSTGLLVAVLCFPELSISVMLQSADTQVVSTALLTRWEGSGGLQGASAMAILIFGVVAIVLSVVYSLLSRSRRK